MAGGTRAGTEAERWASSYAADGFLHVPGVYAAEEVDALAADLERLAREWGSEGAWTGAWRRSYLEEDLVDRVRMRTLHDLQLYSAAWARAVAHPRLVEVLAALLGPAVELHHTTMHVKPPEVGAPFPMHQDHAFYPHADDRYVDVLVHLDDTSHENGEIRFLAGSHRLGPLPHVDRDPDGTPCHPHLAPARYRLEETRAVPARRGDVVCFNINTVHGSYPNRSGRSRRLVRMGYRHPANRQLGGQSLGRPGIIVAGVRERGAGEEPFPTEP